MVEEWVGDLVNGEENGALKVWAEHVGVDAIDKGANGAEHVNLEVTADGCANIDVASKGGVEMLGFGGDGIENFVARAPGLVVEGAERGLAAAKPNRGVDGGEFGSKSALAKIVGEHAADVVRGCLLCVFAWRIWAPRTCIPFVPGGGVLGGSALEIDIDSRHLLRGGKEK